MIGIYKITNQVNGKVYIGQSRRIKDRWAEHLRSGQPEKYIIKHERDIKMPIHLAMQKYGIHNFKFEIIEECNVEELNDKERYWISFYNSTDKTIGYNIGLGGQENFALKGEKHSQAKLTQKQVDDIKTLLKENKLSYNEILALYPSVTKSSITNINTGKTWYDSKEKYPLRQSYYGSKGNKNPKAKLTESDVKEIRNLQSQGLKLSEIAGKYHQVSQSTIKAIYYGETWKHLPIWSVKEQKWI